MAPGIAVGPAHLHEAGDLHAVEYVVSEDDVGKECGRFDAAVRLARRQLGQVRAKARSLHGTAAEELGYLLDAHEQMLGSRRLIEGVQARIAGDRVNAESAVAAEIDRIAEGFAQVEDSYLRARAQEVREVGQRLVRNLAGVVQRGFESLPPESIVVAEEITPADTALMEPGRVAGFATVLGGAEGHTAIMARSLGIPAVLGVPHLVREVRHGDQIIVDGATGVVVVNPAADRLRHYRQRQAELAREQRALAHLADLPAITRDQARVRLHANLEMPREVEGALAAGAEGVGLLRTEFMFMNRQSVPSEEEQYDTLAEIVGRMNGRPVTIRTLDVGGEKLAMALGDHDADSVNPALGLRAIRLSLKAPELFKPQLAAILRAAAHGPVRILLPMITAPRELREARRLVREVHGELRAQGAQVPDSPPPLGAMIEVPGAALAADSLAAVADFFAIGTNDLIQYTLAIDRAEERVAHLFNPLHQAVLRLIQFAVSAAQRRGLPVSVCGEMAGDPRYTPLFLGLGVRELSMAPSALPRVKQRIRAVAAEACRDRAHAIMEQHDSGRIAALLDDFNE